jgi:hypothetical protein
MWPITNGHNFAGRGWARSTISGSVCFPDAAQVLPGNSIYGYFSFSLVTGGSYSIGENVPAGSVQMSSYRRAPISLDEQRAGPVGHRFGADVPLSSVSGREDVRAG